MSHEIPNPEERLAAAAAGCRYFANDIREALEHGGELNSGAALPLLLDKLAAALDGTEVPR